MTKLILLDTNIFTDPTYHDARSKLRNVVHCAVVVQELLVAADAERQLLIAKQFQESLRSDKGVTPTSEDWIEVGRALSILLKRERRRLSKGEVNLLVRDALISRCAVRVKALVLTSNVQDFSKIKEVIRSLKFQSPSEYFGIRPR